MDGPVVCTERWWRVGSCPDHLEGLTRSGSSAGRGTSYPPDTEA